MSTGPYPSRNDRWFEARRRAEDRTVRAGAVALVAGGLGAAVALAGTEGLRFVTVVTRFVLLDFALLAGAGALLWRRKSVGAGVFLTLRSGLFFVLTVRTSESPTAVLVAGAFLLLYTDGLRGAVVQDRLEKVPGGGSAGV